MNDDLFEVWYLDRLIADGLTEEQAAAYIRQNAAPEELEHWTTKPHQPVSVHVGEHHSKRFDTLEEGELYRDALIAHGVRDGAHV